jgi:hypothetical protein
MHTISTTPLKSTGAPVIDQSSAGAERAENARQSAGVIDFAAPAAARKTRRRIGKRPDHPDADLIEHCIEYAMQINAGRVAYNIDPTDAKFASFSDDLAKSRADRAMAAILEIEPVTIDGIRAKAGLIKTAMEDWEGVPLEGEIQTFLISLADDLIRLQRHSWQLKQNLEVIVVTR